MRTQQITIKDLQNTPTKSFKTPGLVTDMFYAGSKHILLSTATSVILYDTELRVTVAEINVNGVRFAVWSHDSSMVALMSKNCTLHVLQRENEREQERQRECFDIVWICYIDF